MSYPEVERHHREANFRTRVFMCIYEIRTHGVIRMSELVANPYDPSVSAALKAEG